MDPSLHHIWTPLELVRVSAEYLAERGIETARLDAEILLAFVLHVDRMTLYVDHARPVIPSELDEYRELIRERGHRVPLQLLTGSVHLFDLEFAVRRGVFIPRPETETLIRTALERFPKAPASAAELGVGCGCVAVSLLHAWPSARMVGWDTSAVALELSLENAQRHGVDKRLELQHGDGVQGLRARSAAFELVVSNPPYVGESERSALQPELAHDPQAALFAGTAGLDLIERLIPAAATALSPGGWLVFEHGATQAQSAQRLLAEAGFSQCRTILDLAGRPRVAVGQR